jgi:hypothetical protein
MKLNKQITNLFVTFIAHDLWYLFVAFGGQMAIMFLHPNIPSMRPLFLIGGLVWYYGIYGMHNRYKKLLSQREPV